MKIHVGDRTIEAHLLSPATDKLAKDPLLLMTFAADWKTALEEEPYNITALDFLAQGHRVISFDLPNHGARADQYGEGIVGMRDAFYAGHDPFALFVQDALATIDQCIAAGIGRPGKIMLCGMSRAGYLSLRVMAVDKRIAATAAYAPVTDWQAVSEFEAHRDGDAVAKLKLTKFVDGLAGRPILIISGNHDDRVSTESTCKFYLELLAADKRLGLGDAELNFQLRDTPGHRSFPDWYHDGATFLLHAGDKR